MGFYLINDIFEETNTTLRKITFLAIAILILSYIYYPVFDSTGISYAIIFLCFIVLCFSISKILYGNSTEDYDSAEKEMDKLLSKNGIFSYEKDGFSFSKEKHQSKEFIKYSEILEVNSFTVPVFHKQKQSGIEIITLNKRYEFLDEYCEGMQKFAVKLSENLPFNGTSEITNNHGLSKTNLYLRETI